MEESAKNKPWWKPAVEIFGRVSAWVVVPIVAALILGKWLDAEYGTRPWAFLSLSIVGFIISTFGIVYTISEYMKQIASSGSGQASLNKKDDTTNGTK